MSLSFINPDDVIQKQINAEISMDEFELALLRYKSKSPGPDGIS